MKKTVFTDAMIKNLKPKASEYWRSEGNGFTIRVRPSGVKIWMYIYTMEEGKRRFMNLGQYPEVTLDTARQKFEDAKRQVKNGSDPLAAEEQKKEERRRTPLLADFVDEYIRVYAKPKLKSWEKIEQALKREIIPVLGKKKITDIKRRDIIPILDEVASRAPVMANRLMAYTRQLFEWAADREIFEINPLVKMKRPGGKEKTRKRNLSPEEIKTLWVALDSSDLNITDEIRRAIKLVMVTAQRPGEVIGMHASEIDQEWSGSWIWTIPADRAKNGQTHRVPLTATALSLIGNTEGKGYVFKTAGKEDLPMTELAMNTAIRRHLLAPLKDEKGNPLYQKDGKPATINRLGVDHFTPHDLRRTATTLMAKAKIPKEYRERVTNHKLGKMDGTYNLYDYDDEKKQALEALERSILNIISGTANVVDLEAERQKRLVA